MAKNFLKNADVFIPQTNGTISDSLLKNWTQQAFECYSIKCNCAKCSINRKQYSFVCQMPKVVKELLKNNIKPEGEFIETNSF